MEFPRCQFNQHCTSNFFIYTFKMFVKLTSGVNLTNILWPDFFLQSFKCLQFGFVIFWLKNIDKKLLVKCWWNCLQKSQKKIKTKPVKNWSWHRKRNTKKLINFNSSFKVRRRSNNTWQFLELSYIILY